MENPQHLIQNSFEACTTTLEVYKKTFVNDESEDEIWYIENIYLIFNFIDKPKTVHLF